ncbi:MAG: enoyl-CoA hydratase-related protein [Bacillota bacterium]
MEYANIIVELAEKIALVTLNRPPVNSINSGLLEELNDILDKLAQSQEARVLVITGAGEKAFSAGADITEFAEIRAGKRRAVNVHDLFLKIENYPKPVIAAINGYALGGGCELAMSCHLRIAAQEAKIGLPEVRLGIIPGWGGTQRLPRLIGKVKALELMLTGDHISAEEAMHLGLVNKVVPGVELMSETRKLAGRLASGAPLAMQAILRAVTKGLEVPIEEGIKFEQEESALVFSSEDAKEGSKAFLEKRAPVFLGR